MFNKRATQLGWWLVLSIVAGAPFATGTRNAPAALAQVSCLQDHFPCRGYNSPDPVSGSALLPDLNGSWMDNGHTVLVTMVANSDCVVSGSHMPCGGGSVTAMYVQPIVCDHQDGTGETDQTTVDFTGQLEDGTGDQPLDIVGTTSACQYGSDNPNGVGFHQTAIYLVVSADAQTLTGIWNNAGNNSPAQLARLMSTSPANSAPTGTASGTPSATPTNTATATPSASPAGTASATAAATPTSAVPATPTATPAGGASVGTPTSGAPSGTCPQTAGAEEWSSDWGPVLLEYGAASEGTIPVSGTWQQGLGQEGCFTSGSYTTTTGVMVLNFYQSWNNVTGHATLQMNSQGTQLTGQWSQSNGLTGS